MLLGLNDDCDLICKNLRLQNNIYKKSCYKEFLLKKKKINYYNYKITDNCFKSNSERVEK